MRQAATGPRIDPLRPDPSGMLLGRHCRVVEQRLRRRAVPRDGLAVGYGWLRGVRLGGERAGELAARADAELGEDLPQVVGDGGGADEQLRGDLRVGGAVAGQAGDQRFLCGQGIWRLDGVLPGVAHAENPRLPRWVRPFVGEVEMFWFRRGCIAGSSLEACHTCPGLTYLPAAGARGGRP